MITADDCLSAKQIRQFIANVSSGYSTQMIYNWLPNAK